MNPARERIRVLIADDTATLRVLVRRTLEASEAFDVVGEATDGAEAVDLAAELQPDLVVLDLSMPVLDGMDAIPRIRDRAPEARIVVLSELAADRVGPQAVHEGAAAFLAKGRSPDDLVPLLLQVWRSNLPRPAPPRPAAECFRRAFEHAPLAMALVGPDDELVYANPALCRLTGYRADQLGALSLAELIHADDREAAVVAWRAVAAGGRAEATVDVRLARPDGRTAWASVSCAGAPDEGDGPGLIVQMVDVTEQQWTVRELTRSNAELSSFAYLAAHELKSPLQTLSGFSGLLARMYGPALEPQAQEFVGWIVEGTARMNSLIEDLLTYCSFDGAEPVMQPVALEWVVHEALRQLGGEVSARNAIVVVDDLPTVTGDRAQLGQLVQNLLANALKFVPEGRRPEVHVSAERVGNGWTLTVADNGIGVEDEARERIFAMFQRLHPRERYKGTGIGLSICKRIVERRGGTIWVEANPGGGSRFRFRLPDVAAVSAASPAA
jgi:PAS domain S-box-containing protein